MTVTTATPAGYTDPFPGSDDADNIFVTCYKCNGTGHIAYYDHYAAGLCFECEGGKGEWINVGDARAKEVRRAKRVIAADKKHLKAVAAHDARIASYVEQYPVLTGWADLIGENNFLADLWTKAFKWDLSEAQVAAAAKSMTAKADREAARAAEKALLTAAPAGKVEVEGEVVAVKSQESYFGGRETTTWKMTVKADAGYMVWTTIPSAIFDQQREEAGAGVNPFTEALKGRRVRFNVTLEPSAQDETFAFGKRPTKAVLL